ncbi:MAG: hypothetical protein RL153_779 [Verrucomicrobiota bacterium]
MREPGLADGGSSVPVPPAIPEHKLLRCIGTGSYGQVWLARSATGSWRAVKVVWRRLFLDDRPFEREWTGVRRFEPLSRESDAFVDVLQTGRSADGGHFYYVMELADDVRDGTGSQGGAGPVDGDVDGYVARTLSWVLKEGGAMPAEACLALGLRLARGLVCLHEAGLLHRDIKPSNIVFVGGQPRLADIGLVTDLGEARSFVGTEGFIPPEGPNSPQADIFGLGKVLYEAMTGLDRMEFPRVPAGLGAGPEGDRLLELNAVVLRACAALPGARYPTARAMSEDLARVADGQSVRHVPHGTGSEGRGRRPLAGLILGSVLVLACIAGMFLLRSRKAVSEGAQRVPGSFAVPDAGAAQPSRNLWRAKALRELDEGHDAEALLWLAEHARHAPPEDDRADRLLLGGILGELPVPDATLDCGPGLFSAAFSPDGRRVATADREGVIHVWDLDQGTRVLGPWTTDGHPLEVAYSRDGQALLAAPTVYRPASRGTQSHGRALRLDPESGRPHPGSIDGILWGVFSDDGRWLAAVGVSNSVVLADTTRPGSRTVLGFHAKPVSGLALSRDGSRVASVSDDRTARVWRVADGQELRPPIVLDGMGSAVAFDSTGERLGVVAWDGGAHSSFEHWDLHQEGRRLGLVRIPGPTRGIRRVTGLPDAFLTLNTRRGLFLHSEVPTRVALEIPFGPSPCLYYSVAPDGRHAAGGGKDGMLRIWSLSDGRLVSTLPKHARSLVAVAFSPDGARLLTASEDGLLRVWSHWLPKPAFHLQLPEVAWGADVSVRAGIAAAVDPAGTHLAARCFKGANPAMLVVPLKPGAPPLLLDLPKGLAIDAVRWGRDGKTWAAHEEVSTDLFSPARVLIGYRDGSGWRTRFQASPASCRRLGIDAQGDHLLVLDDAGDWRRWNLRQEGEPRTQRVPLPFGAGVALTEDGQLAAIVDATTRGLAVWEWDRPGRPKAAWTGSHPIHGLQFLPGSTWLVVEDHRTRRLLLDAATGKALPMPAGSLDGGDLVSWNEPSRRILHVRESAEIELVDLSRQHVRRWPWLPGDRGLRFAKLSHDGQWAATVDHEDRIRILDAMTGSPVTRRLPAGGTVRWLGFGAGSTLVAVLDPGRIQSWSVTPYTGEMAPLCDWATLLTGQKIDSRGAVALLSPSEWSALARTVRKP